LRAILLLLTTLVFVIAIFAAGLAITANLIAEPETHRFANLDAPDLWTSEPVAIDPQKQHYERIAAVPAIASLPAVGPASRDVAARNDGVNPAQAIDGVQTAALPRDDVPPAPAVDPAHAEWCFDRYRSYAQEDNSYQPYGGGPRQQCQSPWTPMAQDMQATASGISYDQQAGTEQSGQLGAVGRNADSAAQLPGEHAAAAPVGAHEEWCHARYRSYRSDDNSYQPFDGGSRRACSSPYG
jgi:hypothetical protein